VDKGNITVAMEKMTYINKMEELLSDVNTLLTGHELTRVFMSKRCWPIVFALLSNKEISTMNTER